MVYGCGTVRFRPLTLTCTAVIYVARKAASRGSEGRRKIISYFHDANCSLAVHRAARTESSLRDRATTQFLLLSTVEIFIISLR